LFLPPPTPFFLSPAPLPFLRGEKGGKTKKKVEKKEGGKKEKKEGEKET
jgi:hypothetical protein